MDASKYFAKEGSCGSCGSSADHREFEVVAQAGRTRENALTMSRTAPFARRSDAPAQWFALCVMAGAALFLQGCASTPLEPWHTAELNEEYRAARRTRFARSRTTCAWKTGCSRNSKRRCTHSTETGSGTSLMRYSKGSASDPQGRDAELEPQL